jgi:osmotically-inducible protein OsmY
MRNTSVQSLTLITCLSALPLIVGLMGCASDRHNQSTGHPNYDNRVAEPGDNQITDQRVEDSRTAVRVREALAAAPQYKFDGVQVAASNGVVQLSGFVKTSAQSTRAGEVASKVVSVKSVENNLTIKD